MSDEFAKLREELASRADRRHCLDPICARPLLLQQIDAQAAEIAALKADLATARKLIVDLSASLTDEGPSWSYGGLANLRQRVAFTLPNHLMPDWLALKGQTP